MIFWILLCLGLISVLVMLLAWFKDDSDNFLVGALFLIMSLVGVIVSWSSHADDLSVINNQDLLIKTYSEQVEKLEERLADFDYPEGALMNADTPVASIVNSLSVWQEKLADAEAAKAKAVISFEARRFGPMSGVISFAGDYK